MGKEARDTLATQQNQFNQAVDQNTVGLNQNLVNEGKADPTKIANDQAKLDEFKKMREGQYTGPQAFEGSAFYQPAKQAVDRAVTTTQNTGTEAGQKQILGQLQTNTAGKTNAGALTFDSSLLQADPTARATLEQARQANADIAPGFQAAVEAGKAKAAQGAAQTKATQDAIKQAFGGTQASMEADLVSKAQNYLKQTDEQANALINAIHYGHNPNAAQLKLMNITPKQWQELTSERDSYRALGDYDQTKYDDLGRYLKPTSVSNVTPQNIATADDYAKYQALNQLMGTNNSFLKDPSLAGQANIDNSDLDVGTLWNEMHGDSLSRDAYNNETQALRQRVVNGESLGDRADRDRGGDVRAMLKQLESEGGGGGPSPLEWSALAGFL